MMLADGIRYSYLPAVPDRTEGIKTGRRRFKKRDENRNSLRTFHHFLGRDVRRLVR